MHGLEGVSIIFLIQVISSQISEGMWTSAHLEKKKKKDIIGTHPEPVCAVVLQSSSEAGKRGRPQTRLTPSTEAD